MGSIDFSLIFNNAVHVPSWNRQKNAYVCPCQIIFHIMTTDGYRMTSNRHTRLPWFVLNYFIIDKQLPFMLHLKMLLNG